MSWSGVLNDWRYMQLSTFRRLENFGVLSTPANRKDKLQANSTRKISSEQYSRTIIIMSYRRIVAHPEVETRRVAFQMKTHPVAAHFTYTQHTEQRLVARVDAFQHHSNLQRIPLPRGAHCLLRIQHLKLRQYCYHLTITRSSNMLFTRTSNLTHSCC